MLRSYAGVLICLPALLWGALPVVAGEPTVRVCLHTDRSVVQAGRAVWVDFTVINLLSEPQTLRVDQGFGDPSVSGESGLPLGHVFSGPSFTALTIEDKKSESGVSEATFKPKGMVPAIRLAPHGAVGLSVDLTQYYEILRRPGEYSLVWRPYNAKVASAPLRVTVLAERQANINTDFGKITLRFYYDEAPQHVRNFIDLVDSHFYDRLTFHRVIPGGLIQGGDPRGDGFGVRADGKRLRSEFSNIPFEYGTVGMARSPTDPDSASSQFFICLSRQPSFDGRQTAFAHVVYDASFETLRRIAAVPTGPKDRPTRPVYIRAISLENVPARERESAGPAVQTQPAEVGPAAGVTPSAPGSESVAQKRPPDPMGLRAVHRRKATSTQPSRTDSGG